MYKYLLILCAICSCHASDNDIEAKYKMDLNKIDTIRLYSIDSGRRLKLKEGTAIFIHDNVLMVRKGKRIVFEYHDNDSIVIYKNFNK